ncbi:MAG: tRNA pseudouridine(38-40) synthase TruA [Bacteroidia bacterium]|nr:tRNA pseudouridine(38-40) synthase TruA [Bacteroidia bacterium]
MRYLLEIAYSGTNYGGWQLQPNVNTVQAEVNKALGIILRHPTFCVGCGRTDAGVHAKQFFLHFDTDKEIDNDFLRILNRVLPFDIAAKSLKVVAENFNARFAAISRTYHYYISFNKDPFVFGNAARLYKPLDIDRMNEASKLLYGKKDFQCFSKTSTNVSTFICDLTKAEWYLENGLMVFEISANRFLRNMVRAITGTMVLVGENKIDISDFEAIIKSKDRCKAGKSMPAEGLYLTEVKYS